MEAHEEIRVHQKQRPRFSKWPVLFLIFVSLFVLFWYGIAYRHWTGTPVRMVTRVIPIPAVTVNGSVITYYDVLERADTLSWLQKKDSEDLFSQSVHVLIEQKVIEQLSEAYDVSLSGEELDAAQAQIQGSLDDEAFEKKIREELNMRPRTFLRRVVEPLALAQKLDGVIRSSVDAQEVVRLRAEDAYAQMMAGASFSAIAQTYSEDASAAEGGDLGYLTDATLPAGWNVLLTLPEGGVSEVIETPEAFVILKVAWLVGVGDATQVRTQAIILHKRTLEDVVKEYMAQSEINYLIGIEE